METRTISTSRILRQKGQFVKGRIVAAGLALGDVAFAAKISRSTLSNHLSGQRRDRVTQVSIWDAYRRLSGSRVRLATFWGELLNRETEAARDLARRPA